MYERTVDGIIRVFIPFYDEIKSLVIIFFLMSRAKVRVLVCRYAFIHLRERLYSTHCRALNLSSFTYSAQ